jgi:hypothetical protein
MPRRILIVGEHRGNLRITPILEGYAIPIVDNAPARDARTEDLAIIPVLRPRWDLEEVLAIVQSSGARPLLFAPQSDDVIREDFSTINGWSAVKCCADHGCFDVLLGDRSTKFLMEQVKFALTTRDSIDVTCASGRAFVARAYDQSWDSRYEHYLTHALVRKGMEPFQARDRSYSPTLPEIRSNVERADLVLAGICDLSPTRARTSGVSDPARTTLSGKRKQPMFVCNANVCFEIGVAIGIGKRVILLVPRCCSFNDIPADLRSLERIEYEDSLHLALEVCRFVF